MSARTDRARRHLVPRDRVTRYGSAGVGVTHYGVGYDLPAISGTPSTRVPEKYRSLVHSVCQGHDTVCDWRYKDLAHPLRLHAAYP